ncbi:hypothetical protein D3C84_1043680 [compost metagenome]
MDPHQEHRAVTGRTGQVGNFIEHPLGDLRTGQGVGLQLSAQALGKPGERRLCGIIDRCQQPAQHAFTLAGRPPVQVRGAAKSVEVFIGNA